MIGCGKPDVAMGRGMKHEKDKLRKGCLRVTDVLEGSLKSVSWQRVLNMNSEIESQILLKIPSLYSDDVYKY